MAAPSTVCVIGAGPAGSVAAMSLARAGWRVSLVEQHRFPRDKVCGECLSAVGIDVLRRLELDGVVRGFGAIPLHFTHLHSADGESASITLPREMWGISRHVLDQVLLLEAAHAGVEILQPSRCEGLESIDGRPIVRIRDLLTNRVSETEPDWVIVADGKSSLFGMSPLPTKDFGLKTHFKDIEGPGDAIELFGTCGTYGGLAPIEANRWNAAFSVPAALLRQHVGDLEIVFERLVAGSPALRKRLDGATRVMPFLASPLPRFGVRRDWPAGVIAVGNAAAAIEPIGGEGMGLALRSAELAAQHLVASQKSGKPLDRRGLMNEYATLWRTRRTACRAAARVVSSGRFSGLAMEFLRQDERAGRFAMSLMGKGSG